LTSVAKKKYWFGDGDEKGDQGEGGVGCRRSGGKKKG